MKKFLALFLAAVMLMGVVGCSGETEKETTATQATAGTQATEGTTGATEETSPLLEIEPGDTLLMGYAITDITPEESTPLGGFGVSTKRWSNSVGYPLKATVMALTGTNGETLLVIETDLITAKVDWGENMMLRLVNATGLPEDHIFLGASHTHCSPDMGVSGHIDAVTRFQTLVLNRITDAAIEALNDRKPAQVFYGQAETEGLNFVRHYYNTNADGSVSYFGDNYGHEIEPDDTTKHMTDADPTIHVVKFTREGEKDVLLCNFRAHPSFHGSSSKNMVSADYIGAFREAVQLKLDCDFMYMQGGCGNINSHTRAAGETAISDVGQYGALLTQYTMEAMENMTPVEGADLKTKTTYMELEINHDLDHLFFEAKNIQTVWGINRDINEVIPMCRAVGLSSPFHAGAVVSRYNSPKSSEIHFSVFSIGENLGFIVCPFEMFDDLTEYIEENAAFDNVVSMAYAYPHQAYLPTDSTWDYTSYETDTFPFKRGTGEIIRDSLLDMLAEIKEAE